MKKILLILSVLFTISITAQESKNDELSGIINEKLDAIWEESNAPGISISVVFPNGEAKTFTRGYANVEKKIKMSAKTKMLGGSTGKVFYSVVALQLIEEGKLKLDEPIYNVMSEYSWFDKIPNANQLTVRSLMRHETGIPRYVFSEKFQTDVLKDVDKVWKPEELLSYVFDAKPEFEVGKNFAYSDTNYIILCMLIEKVTGNYIYEEVQKRVLDKAGLKNVVPQTSRTYNNIAQGYNADSDPFYPGLQFNKNGKSNYNLQFEWAGGGLVITTHDLAILGKKIYEGKMFNASLLKEYFKGVSAGNMGGTWGLGVHIRDTPNGKIYGHRGFMPGYVTNMMYYAKYKFAVCYQINTSDRTKMSIMRQLPTLGSVIIEVIDK
ncbi:serine hydrolase domain-containing protein [Pontimicrobium aquaticum]|uniref:Beta-lactamase family protein n=1 Tax=Pontimicrobium aquaticum TaxID=2565367 RepID=A0A4U0EVX8_9FLAO|nr:serine hydrolase domain-containing protein [Pontimicrobium aquaticum]TJY36045.1 beta-lactamase family protein [Pontimicrobium aquaticum]